MWSTVKHGDPKHTEEATCVFFDGRLSGMFLVVNVSCLTWQQPENKQDVMQAAEQSPNRSNPQARYQVSDICGLDTCVSDNIWILNMMIAASPAERLFTHGPEPPSTSIPNPENEPQKLSEVYGLCLVQSGCHFHTQCPRCVGNKCTFAHLCTPGRVCPKRVVWSDALLTLCYLEAA